MLILVGVTVSVVINSNLIGVAQDAGNRTETAYEEESTLGGVTINGIQFDNIEEYFAPGPELAYSVDGKVITVYLADSYEAYVVNKSIEEKEQVLAEAWGYDNIEDLIYYEYDESRGDYEAARVQLYGVPTYEDALNLDARYSGRLMREFCVNSDQLMNFISSKSIKEKEQAYAEANNFNHIDDLIDLEFEGDRIGYEAFIMQYMGASTYAEALNFQCMGWGVFDGEYAEKMGGIITVTDPSGNEHELYYYSESEETPVLFTYTVSEDGEYKFIAKDDKEKTSELTVPIYATFTVVETDGTIHGPYRFEEGQTWEDYIGETGERVLSDGCKLKLDEYGYVFIYIEDPNLFPQILSDVENYDQISYGGVYSAAWPT